MKEKEHGGEGGINWVSPPPLAYSASWFWDALLSNKSSSPPPSPSPHWYGGKTDKLKALLPLNSCFRFIKK